MAASAAMPDQFLHVRSISVPSRPHPIALRVEEELHKLKTAATSSPPSSIEKICNGLRGVGELYNSVESLLRLPSLQQTVFSSNQKKRLEGELEMSVMLLDLIDNMKDLLAAMKEHVQDLRLALRRQGSKTTQDKEHRLLRTRKEMQKNVNKCHKALKQMKEKCGSSVSLDRDSDLSMVVRVSVESRDITLSVLSSVMHLLSVPWQKQKGRRWSFVSKAIQKRKVACEDAQEEARGFELSFYSSYQCIANKEVDGERLLQAQEQLNAADITIEALEAGLQSLLRRLIQCRVSFLNILSIN